MSENKQATIHYAPYGPNRRGEMDCGAKCPVGYTDHPHLVTCEKCKQLSPGLWPEKDKYEEDAASPEPQSP